MAERVLHIGVDGRELLGKTTGVGRYLAEVLRCWSGDPGWPHRVSVVVPAVSPPPLTLGPQFDWVLDPGGKPGTWWEQTRLPQLIGTAGVDVLFAPAYTAPLRRVCPCVLVVHDVSFFAHPEWFSAREGLRRRWLTRACSRSRASRPARLRDGSAYRATASRWQHHRGQQVRRVPGGHRVHRVHRVLGVHQVRSSCTPGPCSTGGGFPC